MDKKNTFGKNLKHIRKNIFHETQEDFAYALGIQPTAVSLYENGKRMPKNDDFFNNLFHRYGYFFNFFGVTKEKLFKYDLTYLPDVREFINKELIAILFPIIYTEESLKNDKYNNAYNKHKILLETIENPKGELIEEILSNYYECIETGIYVLEANANILSLHVLFLVSIKILQKTNANIELDNITIHKSNDIVKLFLLDYYDETKEKDTELKDIFSEFYKSTISYIKKVRSGKYSDLAYYFYALLYLYNCIDNNFSEQSNIKIGYELMEQYSKIGNVYAQNIENI